MPTLTAQFVKFGVIGGLGFIIEASIITLVVHHWNWNPIEARIISFPSAVLATWWLNRKYNFRSKNNLIAEGSSYFVTQLVGALSNLAVFVLCVSIYPLFAALPVAGLALGAAAGLLVNFTLSHFFVFKPSKSLNE
jgi:putative flippase GtrA